MFLEAGIFDWIGGLLPDAAKITFAMALIAWAVKKWLVPLIKTEENKAMAIWIGRIADDVTDELVAKYPDDKWDNWLDKAVDKIIDVCGIKEEVAKRAVNAAIARKKNG